MCFLDGERADVWHQTHHIARIQHMCCSCALPIHPGETYLRTFCLYDGNISTQKACAVCAQIWENFQEHHGFAFEPDTIDEQLAECIDYCGAYGAGFFESVSERRAATAWDEDERMWRTSLAILKNRQRKIRTTRTP